MSFDVIQAKNLTPRYLGRLARGASGGKFRRLRYFRASFPNRAALVITLRFEDGENQTSVSVSPDSWMHVMHEDFPADAPAWPDKECTNEGCCGDGICEICPCCTRGYCSTEYLVE